MDRTYYVRCACITPRVCVGPGFWAENRVGLEARLALASEGSSVVAGGIRWRSAAALVGPMSGGASDRSGKKLVLTDFPGEDALAHAGELWIEQS